jgi:hypothetical protein
MLPTESEASSESKRPLPFQSCDSPQPTKRPCHGNTTPPTANIPEAHRNEIKSILHELSFEEIDNLLIYAIWVHQDICEAVLAKRGPATSTRTEKTSTTNLEEELADPKLGVPSNNSSINRPGPAIKSLPDLEQRIVDITDEPEEVVTRNAVVPAGKGHAMAAGTEQADQIADQPRIPWYWSLPQLCRRREEYLPTAVGKWWHLTIEELEAMDHLSHIAHSHIAWIMETELGQRVEGDDRCTWCALNGFECWVYVAEASTQVVQVGSFCARCRVEHILGGCRPGKLPPRAIKAGPYLPPRVPTSGREVADQPRLKWVSQIVPPRFRGLYIPKAVGKWWYHTTDELKSMEIGNKGSAMWSNIGRIMETMLGQRHYGEDRCAGCINYGYECWTYTEEGHREIAYPGLSCARCRLDAQSGGCNPAKRPQGLGSRGGFGPLPRIPRKSSPPSQSPKKVDTKMAMVNGRTQQAIKKTANNIQSKVDLNGEESGIDLAWDEA